MKKPNLGQKQTCKKCGARFFDLNKNPATCLKCGETFKTTKPKTKRSPATPTEAVAAVTPVVKADPVAADGPEATPNDGEKQLDEIAAATDDEADDDLEAALEDDSDDDELMEDTSDIGEDKDDMSEVLDHVDDGVGDK